MKPELANIELAVSQIIALVTDRTITEEKFNPIRQEIILEAERIKNSIIEQFLSTDKDTILPRFFEFHVTSLVSLHDDIFYKTLTLEINALGSAAISFVYATVEGLIGFVRDRFPQYLTFSVKAPKRYSESAINAIKESVENLFVRLSQSGMEAKFIESITLAFQKQSKNISYERIGYLRLLQSELLKIDWSISISEGIAQVVAGTLIKSNYNEPYFLQYYYGHVTQSLKACETLSDRIDQISFFYKVTSQIHVIPGVVYEPSLPGVKEQLLEWLASELEYYHQKQQWIVRTVNEDLLRKDFKLVFDMSVANLAFLFKAFTETGIIQNKNASEVIRFLTKFVKTKKSETISYESFRVKYYNAESGTKDAVKKTLQSLLNFISKN